MQEYISMIILNTFARATVTAQTPWLWEMIQCIAFYTPAPRSGREALTLNFSFARSVAETISDSRLLFYASHGGTRTFPGKCRHSAVQICSGRPLRLELSALTSVLSPGAQIEEPTRR